MRNIRIVRALKIVLLVAIACAVFGFIVMSLWNWLMPALIGWRPITFWQALGLFILTKILFGGFRGGWGHGGHLRRRMMERWAQMNPEERENFPQGLPNFWGRRAPGADDPSGDTVQA